MARRLWAQDCSHKTSHDDGELIMVPTPACFPQAGFIQQVISPDGDFSWTVEAHVRGHFVQFYCRSSSFHCSCRFCTVLLWAVHFISVISMDEMWTFKSCYFCNLTSSTLYNSCTVAIFLPLFFFFPFGSGTGRWRRHASSLLQTSDWPGCFFDSSKKSRPVRSTEGFRWRIHHYRQARLSILDGLSDPWVRLLSTTSAHSNCWTVTANKPTLTRTRLQQDAWKSTWLVAIFLPISL